MRNLVAAVLVACAFASFARPSRAARPNVLWLTFEDSKFYDSAGDPHNVTNLIDAAEHAQRIEPTFPTGTLVLSFAD
jgi:hypothetical protein